MPPRLVRKLKELASRTGEAPAAIIEAGLNLYERYFASKRTDLTAADEELENIVNDPKKRAVFREVLSAIIKRGAIGINPETKKARAKAGGEARAKKLSPEKRTEIAARGARARWEKKKDKE